MPRQKKTSTKKMNIRTLLEEAIPHAHDTLADMEKAGEDITKTVAIGVICSADIARQFNFRAPMELLAQCWPAEFETFEMADELSNWTGGEHVAEGWVTWELALRFGIEMVWYHAAVDEALTTLEWSDDSNDLLAIEWLRHEALKTESVTLRLPRFLLDHFAEGGSSSPDDPELIRWIEMQLTDLLGDSAFRDQFYSEPLAAAGNATSREPEQGNATPGGGGLAMYFTRLASLSPGESRAITWEAGQSSMLLHIRCEEHEGFMREIIAAIEAGDGKEFCHLLHLHPGKPKSPGNFVTDVCAALDDAEIGKTLRAAFKNYGFFDWNPATKRFDKPINPKTSEPLNA